MGSDSVHKGEQELEQPQSAEHAASPGNEGKANSQEMKHRPTNGIQQRQGEESASSSSSNGRGSRGGYSADCSSSDSASDTSSKKKSHSSVDLTVGNLKLDEVTSGVAANSIDASQEQTAQSQKKHLTKERKAARKSLKSLTNSQDDYQESDFSINGGDTMNARHVAAEMIALEQLVQQSRQMQETHMTTLGQTLPQWNGVRIQHPMDPRIDLSTVNRVQATDAPLTAELHRAPCTMPGPPPSVDNYMHLMEAVRPFFSSLNVNHMHPIPIQDDQVIESTKQVRDAEYPADGHQSSEGFTSFFSTTNSSDSNSAAKGGAKHWSRPPNAIAQEQRTGMSSTGSYDPPPESSESNAQGECFPQRQIRSPDDDESDSSSMIVLARTKRKHLTNEGIDESINADSTSFTSTDSRPLPRPRHHVEAAAQGVVGPLQAQDEPDNQSPVSSSSSEAPAPPHHGARQNASNHHAQHHAPQQHDAQHRGVHHVVNQGNHTGQSRIVSESSAESFQRSSDQFSSSNTNNNTSGSGSGGNSGSAGNSGSGSGGDGKGSSTDAAKGDNSGGDQNSNSDENNHEKQTKAIDMDLDHGRTAGLHHVHDSTHGGMNKVQPPESIVEDEVSRGLKLIDKKRKRMNMRREYEEQVQQQLGSSDSSGSSEDVVFRPGKPVTLEAVLSFTKIARLVVQSAPPFLVVHVNAAYSGLTGIDSHLVIGKPVQTLLSIPEPKARALLDAAAAVGEAMSSVSGNSSLANSTTGQGGTHEELSQTHEEEEEDRASEIRDPTFNPRLAVAAPAGHAGAGIHGDDQLDANVERLVASSGFGDFHYIQVTAKPHHMLGRNVTVFRENSGANNIVRQQHWTNAISHRDERSHGSSIPSNGEPFHAIFCRMAISPVCSSPHTLVDHGLNSAEQDQGKRRKQYHHVHRSGSSIASRNGVHRGRQHQARNILITHFVIQLERIASDLQPGIGQESLALALQRGDAMEAVAVGADPLVNPDNYEPDGDVDVDDATDSTEAREAVVVIG